MAIGYTSRIFELIFGFADFACGSGLKAFIIDYEKVGIKSKRRGRMRVNVSIITWLFKNTQVQAKSGN